MKPTYHKYKHGDIILVRFPFTDLTETKVRPALVMRDQGDDDIILLPISTTVHLYEEDIVLRKEAYKGKPLIVTSAVRVRKINTLNDALVIKKISSLRASFFKKVQSALSKYLCLDYDVSD